jgi:hypothetical protein
MPAADSGVKKFQTVPAQKERAGLLSRGRCGRRIEMPIGMNSDLGADADGAENDKERLELCHDRVSMKPGEKNAVLRGDWTRAPICTVVRVTLKCEVGK